MHTYSNGQEEKKKKKKKDDSTWSCFLIRVPLWALLFCEKVQKPSFCLSAFNNMILGEDGGKIGTPGSSREQTAIITVPGV